MKSHRNYGKHFNNYRLTFGKYYYIKAVFSSVVTQTATTHNVLLVSPGYVVEDRVAGLPCPRLVEDVEGLERLELVFLVHVMLRHDLLELRTRHVHAAPPGDRREN